MEIYAVTAVVTAPPLSEDQLTDLCSVRDLAGDGTELTVHAACAEPVGGAQTVVVATLIAPDADVTHVCDRVAATLNLSAGAVQPAPARVARARVGAGPTLSADALAARVADLERRLAEMTTSAS